MKAILLAGLLLVPVALSARAKADLRTTVPALGIAPLTVAFIARVEGTEEELWCPEVRWEFEEGRSSARESDCQPYEDGDRATKVYTARYTYRSPGEYRPRFEIRKGGKLLAAAVITVQAIDPTVTADAN